MPNCCRFTLGLLLRAASTKSLSSSGLIVSADTVEIAGPSSLQHNSSCCYLWISSTTHSETAGICSHVRARHPYANLCYELTCDSIFRFPKDLSVVTVATYRLSEKMLTMNLDHCSLICYTIPDGDHGSFSTQRSNVTATVAICSADYTLNVTSLQAGGLALQHGCDETASGSIIRQGNIDALHQAPPACNAICSDLHHKTLSCWSHSLMYDAILTAWSSTTVSN